MTRKRPKSPSGFVLFDVFYDDGSRSSNRKVPAVELGGLDGDEPARAFLEAQESRIAEVSGKPRARIKTLVRAGRS